MLTTTGYRPHAYHPTKLVISELGVINSYWLLFYLTRNLQSIHIHITTIVIVVLSIPSTSETDHTRRKGCSAI